MKTEWGTKRECDACGGRFYDLGRSPIVCPKCDEVFTPEAAKLTRAEVRAKAKADAEEKSRAEDTKAAELAKAEEASKTAEAALLKAAGISDDADDDDDDEEDDGLIEGAFDVDDEEDVADVVDAPVKTGAEET